MRVAKLGLVSAMALTLAGCAEGMLAAPGNADPRSAFGAASAGRENTAASAILEAISDTTTDLDAFDYLEPGRTIALGQRGRATVAYFDNCRVEQIRGGTVEIGTSESRVTGGQISARTIPCKGSRPVVIAAASEAGAGVSRAFPPERWMEASIKGARPILKWRGTRGDSYTLTVTDLELRPGRVMWTGTVRGTYLAYPAGAPALATGIPYEAKVEGQGVAARAVFSIDPRLDVADTPANRVVFLGR
jgi:hypothetical protein